MHILPHAGNQFLGLLQTAGLSPAGKKCTDHNFCQTEKPFPGRYLCVAGHGLYLLLETAFPVTAFRHGLYHEIPKFFPGQQHVAHSDIIVQFLRRCLRHSLQNRPDHLIADKDHLTLAVYALKPLPGKLSPAEMYCRTNSIPQNNAALSLIKAAVGDGSLKSHIFLYVFLVIHAGIPVLFHIFQAVFIVSPIKIHICHISRNQCLNHRVRPPAGKMLPSPLNHIIISFQFYIAVDFIAIQGRKTELILHRPLRRHGDAIQGHFQGFLIFVYHIVFLGQLEGMLHIAGMLLMFLQKQCDIPHGMCLPLFFRIIGITIVVHKDIKHLCLAGHLIKAFMDFIDKFHIRIKADHARHHQVAGYQPRLVHIAALRINSQTIFSVFAGIEKGNDLRHIIKPFVIIQEHKPFSLCLPQTGIPRLGKIPAPFKIHNFVRICLNDAAHLFPASCIYQNQFRGNLIQDGFHRFQTFLHGVRTVGNQNRYGYQQLFTHRNIFLSLFTHNYILISLISYVIITCPPLFCKHLPRVFTAPACAADSEKQSLSAIFPALWDSHDIFYGCSAEPPDSRMHCWTGSSPCSGSSAAYPCNFFRGHFPPHM